MLVIKAALPALCAVAVATALSACSKPKPVDETLPPDPKAAAQAAPQAQTPSDLNQAIRQPIDEAKAVREATEDAATQQRQAIDAATGE